VGAIVAALYGGIDKRLHPAAARSVLAHLIELEQRGVVIRTEEAADAWQVA
jgi:hypothetical protein